MGQNLNNIMRNVAVQLLNTRQMGITYAPNWSKEFAQKEIEEKFTYVTSELTRIIQAQGGLTSLSRDDLFSLGFKLWDEDMPDLMLIPLWAYDLIPDGTELTSIGNDKAIKGKDYIDLDVRFGCIPYGINVKKAEV